ncbi:MAG TPA: DUF1993 domain-containing protein [Burkholderiales bacterium]|nr:DUF1993 domain-containing protein [Burkholderiales bacterium]
MTISMYEASVPVFIRMLKNLAAILAKGASYAEAKKIEPAVLINSRLFPDMFPLARQVQIASDAAKGCGARLAGREPPKFEDIEATFPELLARIDKTIDYLETLKPEQINGSEQKTITMQMRNKTVTFLGMPFLLNFALPNFYFHVTTAYDILRHCGVEIGKQDYIGTP